MSESSETQQPNAVYVLLMDCDLNEPITKLYFKTENWIWIAI